jgi:hypothetical protein
MVILLSESFLLHILPVKATETDVDVFVGVDVAYADMTAIKNLIDKISSYTNVFVIGSTGISYNEPRLNEICQYLYDRGISFIIYTERQFDFEWFEYAKNRWNELFLGFYFLDETGGRQLDRVHMVVSNAEDYVDAERRFVGIMQAYLEYLNYDSENSTVFTSDYALYWFDYEAGWDVVLAQFGWNYSRQLNVALNRGAATVKNMDWGIIMTWTYNNPPYIESGVELYEDLILAYDNGAKYILIFDSNEAYTESIMNEEHFEALEQFWQYTIDNPRDNLQDESRVAFVLPEGYGYGFRGPDDKIWGLWEYDDLAVDFSYQIGSLLEEYGTRLDIVYDDSRFDLREKYSQIILWNGKDYISPKFEAPRENIFSVFVSQVVDGDTFVTREGYRIRLADIDAPELGGVGYTESRAFLELVIENKNVTLNIDSDKGMDPYGRYLGLVYVTYNSTHSINVNQIMVDGGYAIVNDSTDNKFDPNTWSLYVLSNSIPEFQIFLVPLFLFVTLLVFIAKFKIKRDKKGL